MGFEGLGLGIEGLGLGFAGVGFRVTSSIFGKDLIDAGLTEALKMGTGLDFKHLHSKNDGIKDVSEYLNINDSGS